LSIESRKWESKKCITFGFNAALKIDGQVHKHVLHHC